MLNDGVMRWKALNSISGIVIGWLNDVETFLAIFMCDDIWNVLFIKFNFVETKNVNSIDKFDCACCYCRVCLKDELVYVIFARELARDGGSVWILGVNKWS